jgi:penicillin-binding protein 1A
MYKSGQRMSLQIDKTPLTFDLNAPLKTDYSSATEEEEETTTSSTTSKLDYNYLME